MSNPNRYDSIADHIANFFEDLEETYSEEVVMAGFNRWYKKLPVRDVGQRKEGNGQKVLS